MKAIQIGGIELPLPDGWEAVPNGSSYIGDGGMLDVRMKSHDVPIDAHRVARAKAALANRDAIVDLFDLQSITCLHTSYLEGGCRVMTFSFAVTSDSEIVAVYVFRPGFDVLATDVYDRVVHPPDREARS